MIIFYDHQVFTWQKYGGISRYFYELIKQFDMLDDTNTETSVLFSNNYYISDKRLIKHLKFLPDKEFRGKEKVMTQSNKMTTIRQLKKQNFDLFHPTYYDPYFLDYIGNKPFVLTIHDMIHEKFANLFSPNDPTTKNKQLLVQKASKIIAISESTKRDLIELFGVEEKKIAVIYHGNSMTLDYQKPINITLPKKYILFVGSRFGYKNFDKFFEAVTPLLQQNNDLSLICAGGDSFKGADLSHFESLRIKNQIYQYDLDDSTLAYLYKNALLFVFPSLYEGFGIPVLESFACGCPLACSNTSSLPEIAGNAAEYFDPYDADSIRKSIQNIIENKNLSTQLIANGTKRLEKFSWGKTALETKNIYAGIINDLDVLNG